MQLKNKYDNFELALKYVWDTYLGSWYIWGGSDPRGFDCSGLAVEYLKSLGFLRESEDYTAAQLYKKFSHAASILPSRGCLIFYHNRSNKIIHVEILVNKSLSIGANGGGSKVKTVEDAMRHDAFIKLRPTNRRPVYGYINVRQI